MERAGAAATASTAGAKVFGGSRLKTLFGISKGGGARPPPESASEPGVLHLTVNLCPTGGIGLHCVSHLQNAIYLKSFI